MVEIAPIVGNRNQAEDLIEYIKGNMKDNPMESGIPIYLERQ